MENSSGGKRSDSSTDRTGKYVKTETTVRSSLNYYTLCDHCGDPVPDSSITIPDDSIVCDAECAAALGYAQCNDCGGWYRKADLCYDSQDNPICPDCFDENYRICDDCGATVSEEETHWIQGQEKTVCESCRREHYVLCHDCGRLVPGQDGIFVELCEYYICQSCYDRSYARCDRCGNICHYDDMSGDYCDDCARDDADDRIHEYSYKPEYRFQHTNADSAEHKLYFGFELEIEVAHSIADACDVVAGFPYLYMKSDSSISRGFEIVSHPGTLHFWHQEKEALGHLLHDLNDMGCDAEPQGLHVHISKGLMQENHRIRFQSFFDANKDLMVAVARRPDCGYSKHKKLSRCDWKNAVNSPDRYQAVNWQNLRTVEIRMFRGTLEPDEFMASIEFCHAAYQFTRNQVSLATIAGGNSWQPFCAFIKHDARYPELGKYLLARRLTEDRQCA